jgi:tetratricopeptide (TPR) repeat protein
MERKLLLLSTDVNREVSMRIKHYNRSQLSARERIATMLRLALSAGVLAGMNPNIHAQILTKEDLQKAIAIYESASTRAKVPEMAPLQAGQIWSRLGRLYQGAGMYGQSERAYERALRLLTIVPVSNSDLATVTDSLGTLYMETGHIKEAEDAESKALKIREDSNLESDLPGSWYHLATLYLREHRPAAAKEFAERAANAFLADKNSVPEDKIGSLLVLGSSLCQTRKYSEAITSWRARPGWQPRPTRPIRFQWGLAHSSSDIPIGRTEIFLWPKGSCSEEPRSWAKSWDGNTQPISL